MFFTEFFETIKKLFLHSVPRLSSFIIPYNVAHTFFCEFARSACKAKPPQHDPLVFRNAALGGAGAARARCGCCAGELGIEIVELSICRHIMPVSLPI